ncbi:MAG: ABC transporter ATP-binding protein [Bacteroidaceae bacterium]
MEITLQNLSIGYGRMTVSDGLNACLCQGELVCLLGTNGVGKSTLLRTIAGFQKALDGQVLVGGKPIGEIEVEQLPHLMSVVLTESINVQGLSVRELVNMGRTPYTGFFGMLKAEDRHIVDEAMYMVGLHHLAERQVHSLSDGERQKAIIAKALAQQTPFILLDEPTAFLDYPSRVEAMRLLGSLAHDMHKAVLLSTHDVELALQLGDRLWLMGDKGLCVGTPCVLAADGSIARFFACQGVEFCPDTLTFHTRQ